MTQPHPVVGDQNAQVEDLQRRLEHLGHYNGSIDGWYGPGTEEAVRLFQRNGSLAGDGAVDDDTWTTLERESDSGGYFPPGGHSDQDAGHWGQSAHDEQEQAEAQQEQAPAVGELSPDGLWRWDGAEWVSAQDQQVGPEVGSLSEDGNWRWDGTDWQAVDQTTAERTTTEQTPADQTPEAVENGQLSPDGNWRWDGTDWQPVTPVDPNAADPNGPVAQDKGAGTGQELTPEKFEEIIAQSMQVPSDTSTA